MRFHRVSRDVMRFHFKFHYFRYVMGDPSDNEMLLLAIVSLIDHGYLDIVNRDTFFFGRPVDFVGKKRGPFKPQLGRDSDWIYHPVVTLGWPGNP